MPRNEMERMFAQSLVRLQLSRKGYLSTEGAWVKNRRHDIAFYKPEGGEPALLMDFVGLKSVRKRSGFREVVSAPMVIGVSESQAKKLRLTVPEALMGLLESDDDVEIVAWG